MTTARLPLTRRVRHLVGRSLAGLRDAPYVRRWLVLGALIGAVAGLGAAAFLGLLHLGTYLLLGLLGGFTPATPAGEGAITTASGFARPWAIPLVAASGAVLAAIIVYRFAPEAEGHGTDAAIETVHHNPLGLRPRAAIVKMVASALTIGSGGSGGREGPTAQISATFGSVLARSLGLSPADARIAVSAGIASGIGSIFRAPLGGAILGAELPYRDDFETQALLPSLVASIVGFAVFSLFFGFNPIFGDLGSYHFSHLLDLVFFAILGVACGLIGRVDILVFHRLSAWIKRIRMPRPVRAGMGGLIVGGIGLAIPGVLGTGYGEVQQVLERPSLLGIPLWIVIALPFAKILATTLSIGSGGSGGIFGPGMVIGGVTGAAVWRILHPLIGAMPDSPVPFVIIGMIACFGSIAHAPLSVMLMVAEMTGNLSLLAPAIVAVAIAVLVVGDSTIYVAQLPTRASSPAQRLAFGLPAAAAVGVGDVMASPKVVLGADTLAPEAARTLAAAGVPGAPVVAGNGQFLGTVSLERVRALSDHGPSVTVGKLADREAVTIQQRATVDEAVDAVVTSNVGWVAVLGEDMTVAGIVAIPDVVRGYRRGLRTAARRLAHSASGTSFAERVVGEASPADETAIRDLHLPQHTIVLSILRRGQLIFGDGGTTLQAGDRLSILLGSEPEGTLDEVFGAAD